MTSEFYKRLRDYYAGIGSVLRGDAEIASIFPNSVDKGISRERIYAEFLRAHLPSSCNVFYGGFLFNLAGNESKQIDLIISSDSCPQFKFNNKDGSGKSFACTEGSVACASLKSNLDSKELENALENIASIPLMEPLGQGALPSPIIKLAFYDEWPFKIIYSPKGISLETLLSSINKYYMENPSIPMVRRPNLIHVAGKYSVVRIYGDGATTGDGTPIHKDSFFGQEDSSDVFALAYAIEEIQRISVQMPHILFDYKKIRLNMF